MTQTIPFLKELLCNAIIRHSVLCADAAELALSPRDLEEMYEEIGQAYMQDKASEGKRPTVGDFLKMYDPEIMDSQSSSDLELCGRMRIVQADAFKIANTEE